MNNAFENTPAQIQAPCLLDFYKCFHASAYQEGVSEVLINFTGRSGNHSNLGSNTHYMWAGLQGAINTAVTIWNQFFSTNKKDAVATYKRVNEAGLGRECDTSRLEALHDLGYMPLEFRSLPEGVAVPYGVPAFTCVSTHDEFFWLPNFLETFLSAEIWPVQTSLTTATAYMKTVKEYVAKDGTPEFLVPFLCHDFSMRGMMGATVGAGASLSGLGHLMSGFVGSDTLPAALKAETDYNAYLGLDRPFETIASVDATEHSVQCSFNNDDLAYFKHCMRKASPTGILSLVSDGYDFWKLVTEILPELKEEIMARDGKIVIRPDSGDPVEVLCGLKHKAIKKSLCDLESSLSEYLADGVISLNKLYKTSDGKYIKVTKENVFIPASGADDTKDTYVNIDSIEVLPDCIAKGLVETLWDMFGGTWTSVMRRDRGGNTEEHYKLLDSHIGTIYGDSITLERQREIYRRLHDKGFAIGNVVLGVGSYTYQYVTRDTHGSAVKATNMVLNGQDVPIQKEVAGDVVKKSAKGRLVVTQEGGDYLLFDEQPLGQVQSEFNCLELVWSNGVWMRTQDLQAVRANVADNLYKL